MDKKIKYSLLIFALSVVACAKNEEATPDKQKVSPEQVNEFKRDFLPPSLPVLPE